MSISESSIIGAGVVLDASNGPIIIDENVFIDIGALIKGPAYIGKNSIVNPGSKLRGSLSIGNFCKVGGELEDSIIHGYSNKQHDGYLGHSYLGEWVNLGANTNVSDLKNNYSTVSVMLNKNLKVDTKKQFIGSFIGDFTATAISTRFNTGTVVGVGTNIFKDSFESKYFPSFLWGDSEKVDLEKFIKRCKIVMSRRREKMTKNLEERLRYLWHTSQFFEDKK
jgi:UDP-N-acetylglucosamine diphosphorylase/glucosamine-1-phosphate N-acetyltransferase